MVESQQKYTDLMSIIRSRFDYIHEIKSSNSDAFFAAETAAFHGRKIIESIVFGCLVAVERGIKVIPRDAIGKWKADDILKSLQRKKLDVFPSPSIARQATTEDIKNHEPIAGIIEGQPDRCITHQGLCSIYVGLHEWAHELNPYTHQGRREFLMKKEQKLWSDLLKVERLIESHIISINGEAFYCILRDGLDGQTRIVSLSKTSDISTGL